MKESVQLLTAAQMAEIVGGTHPIQAGTRHVILGKRCYEGTGKLPGSSHHEMKGDCHSSGYGRRLGRNARWNWTIWG